MLKDISHLYSKFRENGFEVSEHETMDGVPLLASCRQTNFSFTKFGFAETFFIFREIYENSAEAVRIFSSQAFAYAQKNRKIHLPCGFFESVWVFPVAIMQNPSPEVISSVEENAPRKHWAAGEMPVIMNARSGALSYYRKTPIWGYAYYAGFRKQIEKYLFLERGMAS